MEGGRAPACGGKSERSAGLAEAPPPPPSRGSTPGSGTRGALLGDSLPCTGARPRVSRCSTETWTCGFWNESGLLGGPFAHSAHVRAFH